MVTSHSLFKLVLSLDCVLAALFCRSFIILILGLPAVLFGLQTDHCSLHGRVIDSNTGEPIALVNVYLSGDTFGASTSQTGTFFIENIPSGSYQLIFQHVGYEIKAINVQLDANQTYKIDARLLPKIYDSEEIQVITTEPEEWKKQFKFFIKEFIGESINADDCEILNPEVLNFQFNNDSDEFIAYTDSIVRIKNLSLGYQINLVLADFTCDRDNLIHYLIYPKFEILEAKNEEEQEQWQKNRQRTYQGSLKHFLSSLARGKIMEENFYLSRGDYISWLMKGRGSFVRGDSLKIIDTDMPLYKKFFLDDYLRVSSSPNNIFPSSIIKFKYGYIIIDTLGNVLTPNSINSAGEWYKARVADLLPLQYVPTN
jgi:hypothetical protein